MTTYISNKLINRTLMLVSFWGYPFGGGEEYLYQTGIWALNVGMKPYWLCFANASNDKYDELQIINDDGIIIIKIPGGFDPDVLNNWIKLINPDIIHHQGHLRKNIYDVVKKLRIQFLTGIHFWNGILRLNEKTRNCDILENSNSHSVDPEFIELFTSTYCTFYSVSKFVTKTIKKITDIEIVNHAYSGSLKSKYLVEDNEPINNTYVTIINIHKLKGGHMILYLLKNLPDIPFLVVRTEYQSEELDEKIKDYIIERNNKGYAPSIYLERTEDVKFIYSETKIMLAPSLVDETFCRVVNESMMNGIPVITTGKGNLKYLVEDSGFIIPYEDKESWKNKIHELYTSNELYLDSSEKTKLKYKEYSEKVCKDLFLRLVLTTILKGKENNVMIITPWCDQGLGIQSRNYYNILKKNGYNVFIFSLKPYNANTALELQKDPEEWLVDNIYYSPNDREHVKDFELLDFIFNHNIGKCIIPETCWFRIFEISKLLRDNGVKCYAVPNIEIVRKDEIIKHKYFYKVLCNNFLCEKIFNENGIKTTDYVGYGILDNNIVLKHKIFEDKLKFLFIGGMNAFSRKHIIDICEAFSNAYIKNKNLHLTCTIQKTNLLEIEQKNKLDQYLKHPGITFIQSHLKYDDIINLYYDHHISIQVSKHEGLGLGFYEAIATGTPVITLDTPPHNEIIKDGINGWIIPCYFKKMVDNDNSFIKSAYFDTNILKKNLLQIYQEKDNLYAMNKSLILDYSKRLSSKIFIKKFLLALN